MRTAQVAPRGARRVCVIRQRWNFRRALCQQCAGPVQALTAEEAALAARTDGQMIQMLLAAGRVHLMGTRAAPLICLDSLVSWIEEGSQEA